MWHFLCPKALYPDICTHSSNTCLQHLLYPVSSCTSTLYTIKTTLHQSLAFTRYKISAFGCAGGHVRNPSRNSFMWKLSCVIGRVGGGWWVRADSLQPVVSALWKKRYCNKCYVIEANKIILWWRGMSVHLLAAFISETKAGISIKFGFQPHPRRLQLVYFGSCQSSLWSFCRTYDSTPKLSVVPTKMDTLHIGVELSNPSKREVHVNTVKFDIEPLSVYRILWRYIEVLINLNTIYISGLIPQSLQRQAQVSFASLGWCHTSVECAKSCARIYVYFCSQWRFQYSSFYVAATVTWLK